VRRADRTRTRRRAVENTSGLLPTTNPERGELQPPARMTPRRQRSGRHHVRAAADRGRDAGDRAGQPLSRAVPKSGPGTTSRDATRDAAGPARSAREGGAGPPGSAGRSCQAIQGYRLTSSLGTQAPSASARTETGRRDLGDEVGVLGAALVVHQHQAQASRAAARPGQGSRLEAPDVGSWSPPPRPPHRQPPDGWCRSRRHPWRAAEPGRNGAKNARSSGIQRSPRSWQGASTPDDVDHVAPLPVMRSAGRRPPRGGLHACRRLNESGVGHGCP